MSTARLTEALLRDRLRGALASRTRRELPPGGSTAAAVLVPLFEKQGEVHMWLVRRPTSMRSHAGQVAFPGGKSDASDDSLRSTALREADEELGIARSSVDVLGALDDTLTVTGFTITPWVGWLAHSFEVRPNPSEVARAFSVPVRVFFESRGNIRLQRVWRVDGELVWGATATIIQDFVAIVRDLLPSR